MTKPKYKNIYTRENLVKVKSPVGSHFAEVVKWRIDDKGEMVRKVTKVENIYDRIQAARDSVDLQRILERYENGDASALDRVQGMYIDAVDLPKNVHELHQAALIHDEVFDSMPIEIKKMYQGSAAKFWNEFGTLEFDEKINEFREKVYMEHGQLDPAPVNTSGKYEDKNAPDKYDSEVMNDVEKPE